MAKPPVQRIDRSAIDQQDAVTQMRVEMDPEAVHDYTREIREGTKFDPIEVMEVEPGRFLVIDGFHRLEAYLKARPRAAKIAARILPVPPGVAPLVAAKRAALRANLKHGARLTNADKRHKCKVAWRLEPDNWMLSDREIAELASVTHKTAGEARRELVAAQELPVRDGPLEGQLKPEWLPIRYVSPQYCEEDFGEVAQGRVFHLAKCAARFCKGGADKWSFNLEKGRISHQGIEPGATYAIHLKENHALTDGQKPIMRKVYEIGGGSGDGEVEAAAELLIASSNPAYGGVARALLAGDMPERSRDALLLLLEWRTRSDRAQDEPEDF